MGLLGVTAVLLAIFSSIICQIHYIPAQILIPTYNGSLLTNHTYNNTNPVQNYPAYSNNQVPVYNNQPPAYHYNQQPAYNNNNNGVQYYPWNYNNIYKNSSNGTQDGHLFVGTIQAFDRLLFNQEYFKPSRWWTYREKIIEYPKDLPAGYSRHETLSAIRIYNKFYDGNTARAHITSGGPGSQYVKIKLESKYANGFRYQVQLYGH